MLFGSLFYSAALLGTLLFAASTSAVRLSPHQLFDVDSTCNQQEIERDFTDASFTLDTTLYAHSQLRTLETFKSASTKLRRWNNAAMTFGIHLGTEYKVPA